MIHEDTAKHADEQSVLPIFAAEGIVAAVVFILGAIAIYGSRELGAGWGDDGPQAGYFPFYVGLILCAVSLVNFSNGVFGRKRKTAPFVTRGPGRQVAMVLLPAVVYVGLVQVVGIYVGSAVYIAFFMRVIGKYSRFKSLTVAIAVNMVFFFMFEVWFLVPLYKGIYNPLAFTGY